MLYITVGEQPSGIYQGQVIDVCDFLDNHLSANVRLVAFISGRDFNQNAKKIKSLYPKAIILPMFPKLKNWYYNIFLLALVCLITGERVAICRNVLATKIALSLKKSGLLHKVCFDGRGAIAAEWHEYDVVQDKKLLSSITNLETDAVQNSDYRIAVSEKLINYWEEHYQYASLNHVVIPCTLSSNFNLVLPEENILLGFRRELGYEDENIILVYAGSTAGWQSFTSLRNFLSPILKSNSLVNVLFLSKEDENNTALRTEFKDQIRIKWVEPQEVNKLLLAADYGILLRESTVTNRVAAPTKFAEYLIAGLPVIISENLGDYTDFVFKNECGIVVNHRIDRLPKPAYQDKIRFNNLAKDHYQKTSPYIKNAYRRLVTNLS